jgi:hypothetical protein
MGTPLTGSSVASTYTGLLKSSDNSALTSVLKAVGDGSGLDSALQLSTTAVNTTGDFSVGSNKLTVAAASGNTVVGGTLTVTGATSLSGNLAIPGNLSVTGTSTLTGATSVASTLAVTGLTSLSSVSTSGAATIGTTLGVTGASTLASLGVTGAATVGTTLGVTGATTLATVGATTANIATLNVSGLTTVAELDNLGDSTVGGTLDVTGATTLGGLTVAGNLAANGNTTIGNLGTDLLTINANEVTLPNLTNVTVDLANDKVLITDANDSSKLRSIAASALGINASNAPQCVQTIDTTRQTYSGSATAPGQEITSLSTTITPRSTSSKILVTICINYSCLVNGSQFVLFRLTRNSTEIGTSTGLNTKGISSGSYEDGEVTTISNKMIQFLDSPSTTSPVTYRLHNYGPTAAVQLFLNYATNDNTVSTSSTMVLQEYFA